MTTKHTTRSAGSDPLVVMAADEHNTERCSQCGAAGGEHWDTGCPERVFDLGMTMDDAHRIGDDLTPEELQRRSAFFVGGLGID